MSQKPISTEQLRALRQPPSEASADKWHTIPEQADGAGAPGFLRQNTAVIAMAVALTAAICFLGWSLWVQHARVARELDQTKLELAAANQEVARIQTDFAQASVIHDLWGLGSKFASTGAGFCSAEDDRTRVRAATRQAIEMWSDSAIRAQLDLKGDLLPVLHGLEEQGFRVVGASLPAGVVAQYRRFRRDALGDVVMLDASRIVDADSRQAVLQFLRQAGEGQMDPSKTSVLYRRDEYGKISFPLVQGAPDAPVLQVRPADQSSASAATIAASDYPCS